MNFSLHFHLYFTEKEYRRIDFLSMYDLLAYIYSHKLYRRTANDSSYIILKIGYTDSYYFDFRRDNAHHATLNSEKSVDEFTKKFGYSFPKKNKNKNGNKTNL